MDGRLIPATILARLTIWVWAGYAIWQGQGILWDGPARFGGPSFAILREVPYPTMVWGVSMTISGLLMLFGSLLGSLIMKGAGCIGVAIWSVTFAVGGLAARQDNPGMAGTLARTYFAVAVAVLTLVFIDERKRANSGGRP